MATQNVQIGVLGLPGVLTDAPGDKGLVIFAHGSGSSRLSPRNIAVARTLNRSGFSTLLFDLLIEKEAESRRNVFDIDLLAERLAVATAWASAQRPETGAEPLPIGYFGASTGAAAALVAAAELRDRVSAVVSRGGRPDLAGEKLSHVRSPTLLIVGGADEEVLELNRQAAEELPLCEIVVVPGATHLFEEPGALEEVALHAARWFDRYLGRHGGFAAAG